VKQCQTEAASGHDEQLVCGNNATGRRAQTSAAVGKTRHEKEVFVCPPSFAACRCSHPVLVAAGVEDVYAPKLPD